MTVLVLACDTIALLAYLTAAILALRIPDHRMSRGPRRIVCSALLVLCCAGIANAYLHITNRSLGGGLDDYLELLFIPLFLFFMFTFKLEREIEERKRAEASVRSKQAHLENVINAITDSLLIIDDRYRVQFANTAAQRTFGPITNGTACHRAVHHQDEPCPGCDIHRLCAAGEQHEYEISRTSQSGRTRFFWCTAAPLPAAASPDGRQIVWIARDITARKQTETALKKSEATLLSIFRSSPVGIGLCRQRIIHWANEQLCTITGYTADELAGSNTRMLYVDQDGYRAADMERHVRTAPSGTGAIETRWRRRDGAVIDILLKATPIDPADPQQGITFTALDITARKQAEQAQQLLRTAIDQSDGAIIITETSGRIQYVNDAFARLTGYTSADVTGSDIMRYQKTDVSAKLIKRMQLQAAAGQTSRERFTNIDKHGITHVVDATISPVRDQSGSITNFVIDVTDMTREYNMERQLRQSQKMEAIGTLAGGIAHDFNNILGAIMGYTDLARDGLDEKQESRQCLDAVMNAAVRARELVRQILTFSRQNEQQPHAINVVPVIREVSKLLQATLPKNITIRKSFADEKIFVMADPIQIHQIMINLCTNAVHAMQHRGGELHISTGRVTLSAQEVTRYDGIDPGGYLQMQIRDTGAGINPEDLQRIFDPYFTTKHIGKGTGLGLSVVHGIVKACGGDITCSSEPDVGTTFEILLPLSAPLAVETQSKSLVPVTGGVETLLVVDDEETIVTFLAQALRKFGYTVVGETQPAAALEQFKNAPDAFDLVVTDRSMPAMSGYQLVAAIRDLRTDIPVIMITGYDTDVDAALQTSMGITRLLTKPLSKDEIAAVIREVLDDAAGTTNSPSNA